MTRNPMARPAIEIEQRCLRADLPAGSPKQPRRRRLLIAALGAFAIAASGVIGAPAWAQDVREAHGTEFATSVRIHDDDVPLRNTGLFRYRVVFSVYVGALYAPAEVAGRDIPTADAPKRLELHYLYDISAEDLRRGGRELLERQQSAAALDALSERLDRIDAAYTDVSVGERYALEYHPEHGTSLLKNDDRLVTIEGKDFADAYFGIWLGSKDPLSRGFRDDLLGD